DGPLPAVAMDCAQERGVAKGLCVAYCEALDCEAATPPASAQACAAVRQQWGQHTGRATFPCEVDSCDQPGGACRVFVTSQAFTGSLGGLGGAEAACQAAADRRGLGGRWKAWLSALEPALTRLRQATVPYVLVDGTQVAASFLAVIDGALSAPIDLTEAGGS